MKLVVTPINRTLDVPAGANLLNVLREHGIPISYSCMAGRCGTCRCRVLKGQVLEAGRESRTPMAEDRFVLACQSVLTENCTIEVPESDEIVVHPARIIKASVLSMETLTHDVRQLRVRLSKPLAYSPGQYAQLQFGAGLVRPYSMAGLGDDELEFHVRVMPNGRASQYVADELKAGDSVRVTGPLGTAYLRYKHSGPICCVAGSTGLAPILSIVRGALAAGMTNPIHLYFGVRTPRDLYGEPWLRSLADSHPNLKIHVVIANGNADRTRRSGLVTDAVAADWAEFSGSRAYVCGPPPMVEATALLMKQRGLPREHLYADAFYPTGT